MLTLRGNEIYNLKKTFIYIILAVIPILTIWSIPHITNVLDDLIRYFFSMDFVLGISRYRLSFVTYFIFAFCSGYIIWKYKINLKYLLISILSLVLTFLLRGRSSFYWYKARPELNLDAPSSTPECMFESNYLTYWDYLSNGCHITTSDLIRGLIDRTTFWIIVVLIVKLMFEVAQNRRDIRRHTELLD